MIGGVTIDRGQSPSHSEYSRLFPRVKLRDEAFGDMKKVLMSDKALYIFPEGERGDGARLLELKQGIAYLALDAEIQPIQVVPIGLRYEPVSRDRKHAIIRVSEVIIPQGDAKVSSERQAFLEQLSTNLRGLSNKP